MDDLISRKYLYDKMLEKEELARQRALDTPTHSPAYLRYVAQMNERTALKHEIADAPPAEPTWIPCSERLPNESETWYLNIEEGIHEPNNFIVQVKGAELPTVAMFDGETFIHGYADDGYGFCDEIIAWMPLPEPYKGE